VWHRDRHDRVIEVVRGEGWMFQRDNSIPVHINEGSVFRINANEWHRLIKGRGDLVIKIHEAKKKKLTKKQMKIARAAPPEDEITGADFDALRKDEAHPTQYGAPAGSKRAKQLDATQADLASADPERKARAYRRRDRMEKKARKKESVAQLSESQFKIMINDIVEEIKLESVLNEIEDRIDEKKRKKKKKKSGSRKLSKAVKKSLDKKADKRCLTRGSVYAEFRAGLGAFYTSGSRKGMSAHQWAHARVNSANPSKKWAKVKKRKKCPKKKK
jgi:hypothetical protein